LLVNEDGIDGHSHSKRVDGFARVDPESKNRISTVQEAATALFARAREKHAIRQS
jgi:hypothetical protein